MKNIIYKIGEELRTIVIHDGTPYYCSTGHNSGFPNIWFPFILLTGTKHFNFDGLPSYLSKEKLKHIFDSFEPTYIVKLETNHFIKASRLFLDIDTNSDFHFYFYVDVNEFTERLPTRETIITSMRLSGKNFRQDKFPLVDDLTPEEKMIATQPLIPDEKPLFTTSNPDRVNAWLLDQRATIACALNSMTSLMIASADGQANIVEELTIQKNVDVNKPRADGWTALMFAAEKGHLDVLKILLLKGANVHQALPNGMTPLMIAAANGHAHIVEELTIQKDSNVKQPQPDAELENKTSSAIEVSFSMSTTASVQTSNVARTVENLPSDDAESVKLFFQNYGECEKSSYWYGKEEKDITLTQIVEHAERKKRKSIFDDGYNGAKITGILINHFGVNKQDICNMNIDIIREQILKSKISVKLEPGNFTIKI